MSTHDELPKPQILNLASGAQAVINGAIVTATTDCTLEVGSGAFVLTGRSLWRDREALHNPREELYFSMLEASVSAERFAEERYRLFTLLSQVVAQERTHEAQKECALCASAILTGNAEDATRCAARLASERVRPLQAKRKRIPGRSAEWRETASARVEAGGPIQPKG